MAATHKEKKTIKTKKAELLTNNDTPISSTASRGEAMEDVVIEIAHNIWEQKIAVL